MRKIFSKADEVLVWLGERFVDKQATEDVVELIATLGSALEQWDADPKNAAQPLELRAAFLLPGSHGTPVGTDRLHHKMGSFMLFCGAKRYFSRVWTIQELLVARRARMFWGLHEIDWPQISRIAEAIGYFGWLDEIAGFMSGTVLILKDFTAGLRNMGAIGELAHEKRDTTTSSLMDTATVAQAHHDDRYLRVATVFNIARDAACLDPRDKIFGLLGVANLCLDGDDISKLMPVDHTKTLEEVYMDTTRCLLVHSRTLDVIARNGGLADTWGSAGLPSWVPDYREKIQGRTIPDGSASAGIPFRETSFQVLNNSIKCQGYCFDVVEKKCGWTLFAGTDHEFADLAIRMLDFGRQLPDTISGRRRAEVIWRTSLQNEDQNKEVPSDHTELHFWNYFAWNVACLASESTSNEDSPIDSTTPLWQVILAEFELHPDIRPIDIQERIQQYNRRNQLRETASLAEYQDAYPPGKHDNQDYTIPLQSNAAETRFFVTRRSLLSIGTSTVQERDEIWILASASVPFILRPLSTPGTYSFVGTCFILDHMHGETRSEKYGTMDVLDHIEIH